jgi:hypothetical protein
MNYNIYKIVVEEEGEDEGEQEDLGVWLMFEII